MNQFANRPNTANRRPGPLHSQHHPLVFPAYALILILCCLGFAAGFPLSQVMAPGWGIIAALVLGIAWANSSFDPAQDSTAHRIWQYAAPWVVGGMSFLGGPIGLFFGALGGSMMAGFLAGVSLGAVLSGALMFVGCVVIFALYSFGQYRDYRKLLLQSDAEMDELNTEAPSFDFASAMVSLFWSFLQGMAIVGVLVVGVWQAQSLGLLLALLWNLCLVLSVMLFQLSVRRTLQRRSRFLILLGSIAGSTMLGMIVGMGLS